MKRSENDNTTNSTHYDKHIITLVKVEIVRTLVVVLPARVMSYENQNVHQRQTAVVLIESACTHHNDENTATKQRQINTINSSASTTAAATTNNNNSTTKEQQHKTNKRYH